MKRNEQGFTLLEVLVAMFILIVGIIAVMQMLPTSLLQARMAAERSVGAQIARNVLGSIRAADAESLSTGAIERYDEFVLGDPATADVVERSLLNLDRVENPDKVIAGIPAAVNPTHLYGYQTVVQPVPGLEGAHLYKVTFVLDYADGRSETYVTYVSKL